LWSGSLTNSSVVVDVVGEEVLVLVMVVVFAGSGSTSTTG